MSEAYNFKTLSVEPAAGDNIAVYAAGTAVLLTGVTDRDGGGLANPFTVTQAGGVGDWGFIPPYGESYDVYWDEESEYLGKNLGVDSTQAVAVLDGVHTLTKADIDKLTTINDTITLPQASTEVITPQKKSWFQATDAANITIVTEGVERLYAPGTEILAGGTAIFLRREWFPPDVSKVLTSGDTVSGTSYKIVAQSAIDFTSIGAADNNAGTEFTATGVVTLTTNDSLTPEYVWQGIGAIV